MRFCAGKKSSKGTALPIRIGYDQPALVFLRLHPFDQHGLACAYPCSDLEAGNPTLFVQVMNSSASLGVAIYEACYRFGAFQKTVVLSGFCSLMVVLLFWMPACFIEHEGRAAFTAVMAGFEGRLVVIGVRGAASQVEKFPDHQQSEPIARCGSAARICKEAAGPASDLLQRHFTGDILAAMVWSMRSRLRTSFACSMVRGFIATSTAAFVGVMDGPRRQRGVITRTRWYELAKVERTRSDKKR